MTVSKYKLRAFIRRVSEQTTSLESQGRISELQSHAIQVTIDGLSELLESGLLDAEGEVDELPEAR